MKQIEQATLAVQQYLEPIIGDLKVKTYFSYYGVFKDKAMFALYKDGFFYLRTTKETVEEIKQYQEHFSLGDEDKKPFAKLFYIIPDISVITKEKLSYFIQKAIKEIEDLKTTQIDCQRKQIRYLLNMNINLERLLHRQGITSVSKLKQIGEINAFVLLVQAGIDANDSLLFKLYGAIHHKHIEMITHEQKQILLADADNALYAVGLRRRFKNLLSK